ncbi:MAG: polyprenyl synthetase family protein [Thermaerobacterales bacterium]
MTNRQWYSTWAAQVDQYLDQHLPAESGSSSVLPAAMRYAVFSGGKRLRPVLTLASCEAAGGKPEDALPAAAALELVHTYSLVHDDLPAMDDDQMRRGRPTVHIAYDEAIAILAGDALLTLAFEWLTDDLVCRCGAERSVRVAAGIARGAGPAGLIAGQVQDLAAEGREIDGPTLKSIHRAKTGALFAACARTGGLVAGGGDADLKALAEYGYSFGLAFQIMDDVLDVTGDARLTGRPAGRDQDRLKATFPALYGLDSAREQARGLIEHCVRVLEPLAGRNQRLIELARFTESRQY